MRYTDEREQFDRKINEFQGVQFMLAEMAMRIHAARLMTYHAARLRMDGKRHKKEASMAKLFASEAAMDVTTKAVQLHGGYGYSWSSILRLTPTWVLVGMYTRKRPGRETCVVTRGPLELIGSFVTCTSRSWPRETMSWMGR